MLSKSKFILGRQCLKALWLDKYKKEEKAPVTLEQERVFKQGHIVGELAQRILGNKPYVVSSENLTEAIKETASLVKNHDLKCLCEATFQFNGVLVRVDILNRLEEGWELIEVKSSTSVKDHYLEDVALQVHVLKESGINIQSYKLAILDKENYSFEKNHYFNVIDLTHELGTAGIDILVAEQLKVLKGVEPKIEISSHCNKPYPCAFKDYCLRQTGVPKVSILNLPNSRKRYSYLKSGIVKLDDPRLLKENLSPLQARVVKAHIEKKIIVDVTNLRKWLGKIGQTPFSLDFETISNAIPKDEFSKPYEHIPFQFSLHKESRHWEFLNTKPQDYLGELVSHLLASCTGEEPILVWNESFEKGVIERLSRGFPNKRKELLSLNDRMVDLMEVVKDTVYHPNFEGSFSLKKVAPALLGRGYEHLSVSSGVEAMVQYEKLLENYDSQIEANLKEYCRQDTEIPLEILKKLVTLASD